MTIKLGDLQVRLIGDASSFEKMIAGAQLKMESAARKLAAAGLKMSLAITAPLTGIGIASVKAFSDFDDAMTKATAIMENMTAEVRTSMEEQARFLSKTGVTAADKLAEAYFFLASAGFNAAQAMAALPAVERFATAGAFDMAKATDLITDAQSALGLTSKIPEENLKNLVALSDVLLMANNLSNATAEQFSVALVNKSAAALRLLNKDMEEGVAVLAAFADQGMKGDVAGEALAIVLRDLQMASLNSKEAWQELGISVFDSNGKMLHMAKIIEGLEVRFASMTDEEKKAAAEMLGFQERSFSAIQTLFGTSEKIREYETKLRKAGGVTKSVADKQLKSFASQMTIVKNNVNDVAIDIGRTLAPMLEKLGELIKDGQVWWRGLSQASKDLIVHLSLVAAAIGPLLLGLATITSLGAGVLAFLAGGGAMMTAWAGAILLVAGALALVTDAILQMTDQGNLGISDLVNNFRIGGFKIGTWMQSLWANVFDGWDELQMKLLIGWEDWKMSVLAIADELSAGVQGIFKKIASGLAWIIRSDMEGDFREGSLGRAKAAAEAAAIEIAALAGVRVALTEVQEREEEYSKTVAKLRGEREKKTEDHKDTLTDLFKEDIAGMEELRHKALTLPEIVVPEIVVPEIKVPDMSEFFRKKEKLTAEDHDAAQRAQQFTTMNLNRISLKDPFQRRFDDSTADKTKVQEVEAPDVVAELKNIYKAVSASDFKSAVLR